MSAASDLSGRLFVDVDLAADRADLVETRALAELFAGKTADASKVDQMSLSLRADVAQRGRCRREIRSWSRAGWRPVSSTSAGSRLPTLRAPTSTRSAASAIPFGKPSGRIEASVNAADFQGAADFLASFAPESPARAASEGSRAEPFARSTQKSRRKVGPREIDWRSQ